MARTPPSEILPWPGADEPLSFHVAGRPQTQGHKMALISRSTGRPVVVESAKPELRAWRKAVGLEARRHAINPWRGPIRVVAVFELHEPAKVPAERKGWPATYPDLDTLLRAILDALTGIVFVDDSQVVEITARKVYGPEGVSITVGPADVAGWIA